MSTKDSLTQSLPYTKVPSPGALLEAAQECLEGDNPEAAVFLLVDAISRLSPSAQRLILILARHLAREEAQDG